MRVSIYAAAGAGKAGAYDKIVSMRELKIVTEVKVYKYAELPDEYRKTVDAAKAAAMKAYAPYSGFHVGAAVLLDNGEAVSGNNQENAAYPSGLCAERVTMFYANAHYPEAAPVALAIASHTGGAFTDEPVTPCGACRQVLLETEGRYGRDIRILLYGEKHIYMINSARELLPLSFAKESLLSR